MTGTSDSRCVIVGASHAGVQAATRVRRLGWKGSITLIGDEPRIPYHRPPLSKDYLKGAKSVDSIHLHPEAAYQNSEIKLMLGKRVERIDRDAKQVSIASSDSLPYDKLLLAVGSRPKELPIPGTELQGACYLRDLADVDRIRAAVQRGARAIIVGGGYIGLEAAASLRFLGMKVTVLEALDRVLQRVTCETMSAFFARVHKEEDVDIRVGADVKSIVGDESVNGVELGSGEILDADLVVIGIGIVPNIELAEEAGLATGNGVEVNRFAQTSDLDIYAVGDCASFTHPRYEKHIRLESVQNANDQAIAAAKAICGQPEPYDAVPWFWSDQYDVKLQIAGLAEGADEMITRGDPHAGRCMSLLYLKDHKLLAVDAINSPRDFVFGKKLIIEGARFDSAKLADAEIPLIEAVKRP